MQYDQAGLPHLATLSLRGQSPFFCAKSPSKNHGVSWQRIFSKLVQKQMPFPANILPRSWTPRNMCLFYFHILGKALRTDLEWNNEKVQLFKKFRPSSFVLTFQNLNQKVSYLSVQKLVASESLPRVNKIRSAANSVLFGISSRWPEEVSVAFNRLDWKTARRGQTSIVQRSNHEPQKCFSSCFSFSFENQPHIYFGNRAWLQTQWLGKFAFSLSLSRASAVQFPRLMVASEWRLSLIRY